MSKKVNKSKQKRKRHSNSYYERARLDFINFLANPDESRGQLDFASEKDINEATLSIWKHEEGFWDKVWDLFVSYYLQGQLPAVNRVLIRKAKRGDKDAMDKVYKLAGRLTDKMEISGNVTYAVKITGKAANRVAPDTK